MLSRITLEAVLKPLLAFLAVLVFSCAVAFADTADTKLNITVGGKSDYVIVLSAKASESEKFAASEFADFIKRISGAELSIRADGGSVIEKAVYIGDGEAVKALDVDVDQEALGTDGFIVRSAGRSLVIAGGRKRGTLYGVYDFLEMLGCRWWTPWESFIPTEPSVSIVPIDITEVPALEYRDMMYGESFDDESFLWAARNKLNGMAWKNVPARLGGRYEFVGNLVHSYMGLLAEGADGEITDDMIALFKGKRQRTQPCLSNPKVLKAISRAVIKKIDENPSARFVVVGQNDNRGYCRCENCQAIMDKYHAPSGIVVWFANNVLAEVRKERPNANICTAAYQWSRKPPVGISPADGVFITLCSIECDFAHPLSSGETEVNRAFRDDIINWGRIAKKIYIWDYTPNFHHYQMPHPNLDVLADNIRFFAENSAAGVFEQGCHSTKGGELSQLRMWVLAKSLWDPGLDGNKLIDEFISGYYGPAAEAVAEYCEFYQQRVRAEPQSKMRMVMEPNAWYVDSETVAKSLAVIHKAEKLVADEPAHLRRLLKVKASPEFIILKAGPDSNTYKAAKKLLPEISYSNMASEFAFSMADWSVRRMAERDSITPWLNWLEDYSATVKTSGAPRPIEAPAGARVIQAAQMDSVLGKLEKSEGASDGWAVKWASSAWLPRKHFTDFDDITPGESYKLFIRVKCLSDAPADSGKAFMTGVRSSGGNKTLHVGMDKIETGSWQVYEVANWQAASGDYMFFALESASKIDAMLVDAMWLEKQ